jgi:ferredoxin, 2Fe-2S
MADAPVQDLAKMGPGQARAGWAIEPSMDEDVRKLVVFDRAGARHDVDGLDGWRVMEIIRDNALPIKAECGGACACATCHVYVDDAWFEKLPEKSDEEIDQLALLHDCRPNSRLSCQMLMSDELDGLTVELAPTSAA